MFDSSRPPLLVLLIPVQQLPLFTESEGYNAHYFSADHILISYKEGWSFPLSLQQQKFATEPPLLLVRSKGRITTAGGTFNKGYSHQFCNEDGGAPSYLYQRELFDDQPGANWMFVQNTITMVWLQYGNTNQYLGEAGSDIERTYYGKLIIRKFLVDLDYAPRLDKNADNSSLCAKLYRVESSDFFNQSWTAIDQAPEAYLNSALRAAGLDRFAPAVKAALKQANTRG